MESEKRITIRPGNEKWECDYVGDPDLIRLFGTNRIPTPFSLRVGFDIVKKEIQAKNPEFFVE